ncbi:hypothetical protein V5N11_002512 [Cardamine amara subsp. amara]|uniref:Transposase-associated domain-containing protein n=1 Tax=Cardamine amara subsp. amara TaxID=228776 RepID=A0ABD1B5N6_CARAN
MDNERFYSSSGCLTREFAAELTEFVNFATNQAICLESGKLFCPCPSCDNNKFLSKDVVWLHLYRDGFRANYKVWYYHGKNDSYHVGSSSQNEPERVEEFRTGEENVGTVQMVHDSFMENMHSFPEDGYRVEEPNLEARRFFDMLDASKNPLYEGCKEGHSPLSAATRMMNIKMEHNLSEECVDAFADFVKDILPEENLSPASYYEIEKLVSGLGLPYQMIDVCINNCMIYWKSDANYFACRFCGEARFQNTGGRVKVPIKCMWYLPFVDRLKRLYQSERTARPMRWHREHTNQGEIAPPELDGENLLMQLRDFGAEKTTYCGGNGHLPVNGYGEYHNWYKKSIFWDLPYWKDHLLRHNLDVMHIEKNFFDNIMNTVLNVQGRTKDNLKSRLDLPTLCVHPRLHVLPNGKGPRPPFRLDGEAKNEFFHWIIHSVKFPDGYASNL